jgi:tetratricopeptide (TPR) repeat protein
LFEELIMKRKLASRRNGYLVLAGAVALALPSMVMAQGQIDVGRANDASNQVGSGGRNAGALNQNYYNNSYIINNGNRVVTGNVSQGREFHGTVSYTDPSAFRGTAVGLSSENFTKNSVGVPHTLDPLPNRSTPFYGVNQTATPPAGFQLNSTGTGFVAPPRTTPERGPQDQRLGIVDLNEPIAPLPTPGEMVMRGSLNPQQGAQQAGVLTGSALYGVREWNPQDPADRVFLENILNRQNSTFNRVQLDPREVQRMRSEIERALQPNQTQQPNGAGSNNTQAKPQDTLSLNPLGTTLETPGNPAVQNKPINDQVQSQPLGSGATAEQGMRYNVLGAAHRTSTQYAELNKRLEQFNATHPKDASDFAREFNAELKAKNDAEAKALALKNKAPGDTTPDLTNRVKPPTKEDTSKPDKMASGKKPAPLKIKTLSQGVVGEGLANVLKKAETLMREGKFASALDQYDAAEAVTPNNPLIWLGKANAELGAGFFKRAEGHLQQAFMTDNALLMGQYDLTAMLGEDRLTKLVQELKDNATKNPTESMPLFLLGYIAYNTGHEPQAMAYLDLAEKRGGNQAVFYKTLRDHWALPEAPKTGAGTSGATPELKGPELNK